MSSDLQIYEKLLRVIRERKKAVEEGICYGAVLDHPTFREMRGKLSELQVIEQEIKLLLDKVSKE